MPTHNPRVNVTFNSKDYALLKKIAQKEEISMSLLIRKVVKERIFQLLSEKITPR